MQSIQKTRFIAANYSNLQGLKAVPLGLLLVMVVVWANGQTGRATDLSAPVLFALGMAVLLVIIHRYYRVRYGLIESTTRQKGIEVLMGIAGGAVGLGAFLADISFHAPVSWIGLVFAASVVVEYIRMQLNARGHYMFPFALAAFVMMLVISILPLLGAGEWWRLLGLRAQLYGVLVVIGALIVLWGLFEHWFLVRQLPAAEK